MNGNGASTRYAFLHPVDPSRSAAGSARSGPHAKWAMQHRCSTNLWLRLGVPSSRASVQGRVRPRIRIARRRRGLSRTRGHCGNIHGRLHDSGDAVDAVASLLCPVKQKAEGSSSPCDE